MNILIVEDNKLNLKVLEKILWRMGYKPDIAENGLQAVIAVDQKSYDLVFMDLQMPVMGGIEATRRIHENLAERSPLISAFTANSHHTDRVSCKDAGMHDFIAKPTTPKRIEEVIRSAYQTLSKRKSD